LVRQQFPPFPPPNIAQQFSDRFPIAVDLRHGGADYDSLWTSERPTQAQANVDGDGGYMAIQVRKGQGSVQLTREEFERRLRERFYDPEFASVEREIAAVVNVAWKVPSPSLSMVTPLARRRSDDRSRTGSPT
jgi:hypothetical protein